MLQHTMTLQKHRDDINKHLDKMSKQGWELVSSCSLPNKIYIYLFWKMPLSDYQELLDREKSES